MSHQPLAIPDHFTNDQLQGQLEAAARKFGHGVINAFIEGFAEPIGEEENSIAELIEEMKRRKLV